MGEIKRLACRTGRMEVLGLASSAGGLDYPHGLGAGRLSDGVSLICNVSRYDKLNNAVLVGGTYGKCGRSVSPDLYSTAQRIAFINQFRATWNYLDPGTGGA